MEYPFTPIPKWFFQLAPNLGEAELRIMLTVWDQTTGWQTDTNILSYTFISRTTGLKSTTSMGTALRSLEARGLIRRETKRTTGQKIQVFPKSPILPVEIVEPQRQKVQREAESMTPLGDKKYNAKRSHNRIHTTESFKESNTMKLTESQEESLALIVGVGLSEKIARRLIALAWSRGRDISYIRSVMGYVAKEAKSNPAGLVRTLITQDSDVNPPSKAILAPDSGIQFSKWDHGGKYHDSTSHSCEICHPELIAQREARERAWRDQDGQDGQDGQP